MPKNIPWRTLLVLLLLVPCAGGVPVQEEGAAVVAARVLDAETKQVIPCTVTIHTSQGRIITDHPSFKSGFRSSGTFEKAVPPGETKIRVGRGFDYVAVERTHDFRPGERVDWIIELPRRTPLRRQGWYAGDSHVHMMHGEQRLKPEFPDLALAGRAEGLDYMAVAQHWNLPEATPERLEQACRAVSAADFLLTWNMEIPKNYWRGDVSKCLGHGWTVAMRGRAADGRDAIAELTQMSAWDYESERAPTPNFESHALIHALGGIVSYTHPARGGWGRWGGKGIYPVEERKFISNLAQELPFDTVIGPTYDMIDILMPPHERVANEKAQQLWFMLLNHGYRIAATASSDSSFDNEGRGLPGRVRVYTRVEGPLTLDRLASALKAGRNFVTSGPLLVLEIGPHAIGDVVRVDKPLTLTAQIKAWTSGAPDEHLTKIEVLRNGAVIKTLSIPDRRTEFTTSFEVREAETAWYIVRAWGSSPDQIAITNPIYFAASDYRAPQPAMARVTGLVTDAATGRPLDGTCEVIEMIGRTPARRSQQAFKDGRFTLRVPGAARLRVQAPGYAPVMKSLFMDDAPLRELTLNLRGEALLDWRTFEKIRARLDDIALEFGLSKRE